MTKYIKQFLTDAIIFIAWLIATVIINEYIGFEHACFFLLISILCEVKAMQRKLKD